MFCLGSNIADWGAMKLGFAVVLLVLLSAQTTHAHPYFPLKKGATANFDYKFSVDSQREEYTRSNTKGKMISSNTGEVDRDGKRYFRFETRYEGISYMQGVAELWRRDDGGKLLLGSMIKGQLNETVELPEDTSVGQEWDYFDGEQSKRKITGQLSITLPNGLKLPDCLEVSRTILKRENLKDVVNKSYYCRDVGTAGSLFTQPSPIGEYRTESTLVAYSRGE